jgi:hypothetical protein
LSAWRFAPDDPFMFNPSGHHMISSSHIASQQRFHTALMAMAYCAIGLTILFPLLAPLLPHIPTSGHSHVHAHGHAFIDARSFFGIPNFLDVISNLPFLIGGICGLIALRSAHGMAAPLQTAARVFFIGLILTCLGSSYYHYAPTDFTLMIDRLGMAVAFAGVISLAAGGRKQQEGQDKQRPNHQPRHRRLHPADRQLIRDHHREGEFKNVVVRCACELRPEEWSEAALA